MGVESEAVPDGLRAEWGAVSESVCPSRILQKLSETSTASSKTKIMVLNSLFLLRTGLLGCSRVSKKGVFFSRLFNKRNNDNNKKPVLDLVDGLLNPQLTAYSRLNESQRLPSTGSCTSRDIQLQCLDARALLARTNTSTPASSLDLEWEHETIPISMIHDPSGSSWTALPEDLSQYPSESSPQNTAPALNSDSDWSRVSSANSLEWDNVQSSMQTSPPASEVDTDTQLLLSEIERLTSKTLRETGQDLFS